MAEPQYAQERYDFDTSGNLIYRAGNTIATASDSETSWFIYKYTWDSSSNLSSVRGPVKGAWTNRSSIGW